MGEQANDASVTVLDEQDFPGGQIYRALTRASPQGLDILGPDYSAGRTLTDAFSRCGAWHETGAAVWEVTRERVVHYLRNGAVQRLQAQQVILATGALERPFPIPGWTLPGVMTAGAAQILLKTAEAVPSGPVVLAGCGPLLYLLAWQYLRARVSVTAIVDITQAQDYWRAAPHLAGVVGGWRYAQKGLAMLRALKRSGIPFHKGAGELAIEGDAAASALRFRCSGKTHRIAANLILLHQGVVPDTQITWALRASHHWDPAQLCWTPDTDEWGELDVPGVFVAGDGRGIAGAQAAALQGTLAGIAAAHRLGRITESEREQHARLPRRELHRHLHIRPLLDALYRPQQSNRVPADDVVVCRCEEVTAGDIRRHVALGCLGPNQTKAFSRCGMGPCQGRQCGLTVTEVIAQARGVSPAEVGYYRMRPPIKPVSLGELASG